jgi:hypothetical protein
MYYSRFDNTFNGVQMSEPTNEEMKNSELILLNSILPEMRKQLQNSLYDLDAILSASRLQHLTKLRQVLVYYLNKDLKLNYSQIGYIMRRNRTNCYYSIDMANWNLFKEKDVICINFLLHLRTLKIKYLVNTY